MPPFNGFTWSRDESRARSERGLRPSSRLSGHAKSAKDAKFQPPLRPLREELIDRPRSSEESARPHPRAAHL